jgi:hypothetical protein
MLLSLWLIVCILQAPVSGVRRQITVPLSRNLDIALAIEKYGSDLDTTQNDVEAQSSPETGSVELGRTSFWTVSSVPGTVEYTEARPVTLGLKFSSEIPGAVTALRFYKGSHNTGTHIGNLWSNTGNKLATVVFPAETPSGWQQANLSPPVTIAANTTYVISYFAPNGHYACDPSYSWGRVSAAPLHVSGAAPGVFAYGPDVLFPVGTWNGNNYWVDLVFAPSSPQPLYAISGSVSGSVAILMLSGAVTGTTTTDAQGRYTFSGLKPGMYVVTAHQPGYGFTPPSALVTVNAAVNGVNFTAVPVLPVVTPHSVNLNWVASTSVGVVGYYVYRGNRLGGTYAQIGFTGGTSYVDTSVLSGQTYFYAVTAVDGQNKESMRSTPAMAIIPVP